MMKVRRANERGHANFGWLDTHHTFSFGRYHDPNHMGFRSLRVLNDDRVQPGEGFGTHGHDNMEIVTYVLDGALEHRDSMGSGSVLRYGDIQRMSAGTGVTHSEFNHSKTDPLHFLQIWILPSDRDVAPEYEETHVPEDEKRGKLRPIVTPDGRDGSLRVHQDVAIFATLVSDHDIVEHSLAANRHAWVHVATGSVRVNGELLHAGDGAALSETETVTLQGLNGGGEALVFDLG